MSADAWGIKLLHKEALASLAASRHYTPDGLVITYQIDVDSDYDNVVELNIIWQLPNEVIQQFREQRSSRRYAVLYIHDDVAGDTLNTTLVVDKPAVVDKPTSKKVRKFTPPTSKDNISISCKRRIEEVKTALRTADTGLMNPVIPEGFDTEKLFRRAVGISTGCPPLCIHSDTFQRILNDTQTTQGKKASLHRHVETDEDEHCNTSRRAGRRKGSITRTSTRRTQDVKTQKAKDTPTWGKMASRYPSIKPTLVNVQYDGVTVYDSPATSPVSHTG